MLTIINDLPEFVLGLSASGEVTAEDYRTVLIPALEAKLTKHQQVRLLYLIGEDFGSYTGGAAWEDAKVGMKHLTSFQRIAVVTDVEPIAGMIKAFGFALPGEVRVFPTSQLDPARDWVSEPASKGHLSFDLKNEAGVLVLEPKGHLEAADFERLAAEVDPYLERSGPLKGLMVIAEHFPGWDDFSAFSSHLRFVRDHHKQVGRVALVTNDRLVSALPRFASRFMAAKVHVFAMNQREAALDWASQKSA